MPVFTPRKRQKNSTNPFYGILAIIIVLCIPILFIKLIPDNPRQERASKSYDVVCYHSMTGAVIYEGIHGGHYTNKSGATTYLHSPERIVTNAVCSISRR